ncbi:MAG TPA: hypothetical protein VEI57_15550 [Nitrospirota bacterium]|nr:hypothetical protein [Nitrospirota bacterium]
MNSIPDKLDLSNMVGSRLDTVSIQEYQTAFQFNGGSSIVVEGAMDVILNGNIVARWRQEEGWTSIDFQKCVGTTVEQFAIPSKKELDLYLSGGWVLRFFDSSPQYESFHIYPQDIHV